MQNKEPLNQGNHDEILVKAHVDMPAECGLAPSRVRWVYLAGPMTGLPGYNFAAFNASAAALRERGLHVENPAEHGLIDGAEWGDYLRYDLTRLVTCERIAMMPGWSKSKGATLELHVAQTLGMPVEYLDGAERYDLTLAGSISTHTAA